ncbi:glucuronate isomerase [Fusobacterium sp. FSA-380-WT-3A]|nr:hypothetical protein [Fusobacterium sp. FSA-380-WT-3A]NME35525.1 glucuronate isomerase [Fusobacterium sp. FSA-380-WT-3A]
MEYCYGNTLYYRCHLELQRDDILNEKNVSVIEKNKYVVKKEEYSTRNLIKK